MSAADWMLLVLPGLIWGASFLFIAEGLTAMAPDGITFARFVIGFLTLSMIPAARKPIAKGDGWQVAAYGLLGLAFPMSMFPHAEQSVSSALAGMLNGTVPLFTAAVAALIHRQAPPRPTLLGLVVGFTGAVFMAWPGLGSGGNSARGVLMILAAVTSYGIAINLSRPLQQRSGALPIAWRAQGVSLLLTAPLGARPLFAAHWSLRSALAVLALGCLGTAAANAIMAAATGRLGATRSSATTFLIPVVALLLGVLVRGEHVAMIAIAGSALCLSGAWLMRQGSSAPASPRAVVR